MTSLVVTFIIVSIISLIGIIWIQLDKKQFKDKATKS